MSNDDDLLKMVMAGLLLFGIVELLWLTVVRKRAAFRHDYSQLLKNTVVANVFGSLTLPLLGKTALALWGASLAPFSLGDAWYVWLLALLIYEFWYWVLHYLAHKVRLLWCIHSPHHAPDTMNIWVGFNHHFLELPYMAFFLGFVPALCGVPVEMIMVIAVIDVVWGNFLHISPHLVDKRLGVLEHCLQTPRYHRVHHAQNPRYMDTNYNSITLFWDWALGTLQPLRDDEPVSYGITREVNTQSWWDVQFGEFYLLWKDVVAAPGLTNKLGYLLMPPGWSHTGDHKTASTLKKALAA